MLGAAKFLKWMFSQYWSNCCLYKIRPWFWTNYSDNYRSRSYCGHPLPGLLFFNSLVAQKLKFLHHISHIPAVQLSGVNLFILNHLMSVLILWICLEVTCWWQFSPNGPFENEFCWWCILLAIGVALWLSIANARSPFEALYILIGLYHTFCQPLDLG